MLVEYAERLVAGRQPQTVGNYMSHLQSVFAIARPAWGMALDAQAMRDAMLVCKRMGLIAKSNERDRRPTVDEMGKLMAHFEEQFRRGRSMPMHHVVAFALFSTRRQEEITRIRCE